MTLADYVDQLSYMIDYVKEVFSDSRIVLVGSGAGNIYLNMCPRASAYQKICIHPEVYNIWEWLDKEEKEQNKLDTYCLYSKYEWAEEEFLKLGNVFNRASGYLINNSYFEEITKASKFIRKVLKNQKIICVTNEQTAKVGDIVVQDSSYLLMSAMLRGKVIKEIQNILSGDADVFLN